MNAQTSTHQLHACQYLPRVLSPVVCRMHAATNIMCPLIINTHRLPLHQHHHTHHQHSTVIGPHHAAEAKLIRPRRGISMGRFFGTRIRSRFADSDFSFPKSTNLRRCTKRTQNLDFVYFQFPLTACKIPVAVESETGTHGRSVRTEATIFCIFFLCRSRIFNAPDYHHN